MTKASTPRIRNGAPTCGSARRRRRCFATLAGASPTTANDDVYIDDFSGTSAATPIVSGVVALVRSANPALTWRDVKLILAESARKNDPDNTGWEDGARKKYGAATDLYHFNHEYGFGVVDAKAAVDLAAGWTTLPTFVNQEVDSATTLNLSIPDCADSNGCPDSDRQHRGQQHPHHGC